MHDYYFLDSIIWWKYLISSVFIDCGISEVVARIDPSMIYFMYVNKLNCAPVRLGVLHRLNKNKDHS